MASIKLEIDTSRISLKFHVHKYNFPQKINFVRKNEAGHDTSRISLKFHVHKYNFPQKINFARKNEAGHDMTTLK